jgi:hypothetical protein
MQKVSSGKLLQPYLTSVILDTEQDQVGIINFVTGIEPAGAKRKEKVRRRKNLNARIKDYLRSGLGCRNEKFRELVNVGRV